MELKAVYFVIFLATIVWITWAGIRQIIRKEKYWEGLGFSLILSTVGTVATSVFIFFTGTDNDLMQRVGMTFFIQLLVVLVAVFYGIMKMNRDDRRNVLG